MWWKYVIVAILAYHGRTVIDNAKKIHLTADDIVNLAKIQITNEQYMRSIYMFYCAGKMQKFEGLEGKVFVLKRVRDIRITVGDMSQEEKEKNVKDYVIPLMEELLQDLRNTKGGIDDYNLVLQGWCMNYIAACYNDIGKYQQAAEINESFIKLMSRKLREGAERYHLYGLCYNDAGIAYLNMNQPSRAIEMFNEALDVYEEVTDWSDRKQKKSNIRITKKNLEIAKDDLSLILIS